jgi:beta-N-acetylhexosaminidase
MPKSCSNIKWVWNKKLLTLLVLFYFSNLYNLVAQSQTSFLSSSAESSQWVDSVFRKMKRKEKIAQLFMVRAHSNLGQQYADSVAKVIRKEHLGGVVFFQGGPVRQALIANHYQSISKIPLMIAMDAEWGLGMRLDSTISYPYQMTLGAIQDNQLIYKMGQEVAKDFKRLGMQINFAPVMDVNNNPKNPVINFRSFGENKFNVTNKSITYFKGLQDEGIFTTGKHFPGHGDTDVDSHYDLPQLGFSQQRLDSLELYPFKQAFANGLSGVMVAHMNIPALDSTKNLPSTLSKPIVSNLLKKDLGFKGLVFSDAMNMKGVVKYFPNGEADLLGIIAGNDVLELSENSGRAIKLIRKAIRKKRISWDDINNRVIKILTAKYWMGLHQLQTIDTTNLVANLNRKDAKVLVQQLTDAAITVLSGEQNLPLKNDPSCKTAVLSIGPKTNGIFAQQIKNNFANTTLFTLAKDAKASDIADIQAQLKDYDQIVMAIYDTRMRPASQLDYSQELKQIIAQLATYQTISVVFANPYSVTGLAGLEKSKALIMGYQNLKEMESSAAKLINGNLKASGKLPVTINNQFKYGDGVQMK